MGGEASLTVNKLNAPYSRDVNEARRLEAEARGPRPNRGARPETERARGRDRGQRFEAKAENEAQIVCKNRIVSL